MLEPRDGEMNYDDIEELAFYFMFVSACLSEENHKKLKEAWDKAGGFKVIPWWKYVMENTKVDLDIK